MRTYLRTRAAGGTYFFTVNLAERRGNALLVERIAELRAAVRATCIERPFEIPAMVVLPDHLHCLWRLPSDDSDFPTRWRLIKSRFARAVPRMDRYSRSRRNKGERGIWQRRYWEHVIRDDADFRHHLDYIHFNPVKHGYVHDPAAWPYSSFPALGGARHLRTRLGQYHVGWVGFINVGWVGCINPASGLPVQGKLG